MDEYALGRAVANLPELIEESLPSTAIPADSIGIISCLAALSGRASGCGLFATPAVVASKRSCCWTPASAGAASR